MSKVFFSQSAANIDSHLQLTFDMTMDSAAWKDAGVGILERCAAFVMLAIALPVLLVLALINKLTSKGPVFYSQVRVGKDGELFQIHKFRTMVLGAESKTGPVLSWVGDPRITPWGDFLRKSHLDELPQLFNVLKGEMSFIGPRPERPEFVDQFKQLYPSYANRLRVNPGITGLAQICAPYDVNVEEKLKYDLIYVANQGSLRMAFFILRRTLLKVVHAQPGYRA